MIALNGLEARQHHITVDGIEELRRLLNDLKDSRSKIADEVRSAAAQSSRILEDPIQTLNYSKGEEIDEQISVVERIIAKAKIITKPEVRDRVQLGSRVIVRVEKAEYTYSILGSLEADPAQGKISNESPLGQLLLGKKVNDRFEIMVKDRKLNAVVIRIE